MDAVWKLVRSWTAPLSTAVVGVPYAARLRARSGTPPYRWRSISGPLPAGLHLAIYSAALIVVMLYFPAGLAGALSRLFSRQGNRHQ